MAVYALFLNVSGCDDLPSGWSQLHLSLLSRCQGMPSCRSYGVISFSSCLVLTEWI